MKNDNLTLLIMAAGMGSRFGGLKQVEPIGPNGEFIIDYSIYDAIKAGFKKIVFIIKEENYNLFRETIGKRIEDKIEVEYAFQKLENIPSGYQVPTDRVKPWGTAQAILSSKNNIQGSFAVINSDDFYGRDAFYVISDFLKNNKNNYYSLVGYQVKNTLTENGSVKRGICKKDGDFLVEIVESKVEKVDDKIIASPLNGDSSYEIEENSLVSMNMLGFTSDVFSYIEEKFPEFLKENKDNLDTCEFLIPDILQDAINENKTKVQILKTTAKWEGVTYKEDKEQVVNAINKLITDGVYPQDLWK